MTQSDERLWATLSHISIPFIGVVGPLIVYLVFKDRSAFLKDQGTESLNFSILYTIAQVAGWIMDIIDANGDIAVVDQVRGAVAELCQRYPVYRT